MWQMGGKGIGSLPAGFNEWIKLPCQRAEQLQITWQASTRGITKRAWKKKSRMQILIWEGAEFMSNKCEKS